MRGRAAYGGLVSAPSLHRTSPPPAAAASAPVVVVAAVADVVAVTVFTAVGRSSHAEGLTLAGMATTTWPFLAGAAAGWLVARAWRRPLAVRTGAVVWAGAVVVGMGLRVLAGQGSAISFAVVTAVVLGVLLVGWRAVAALARRRRWRA